MVDVAQLVERRSVAADVAGSSPVFHPTKAPILIGAFVFINYLKPYLFNGTFIRNLSKILEISGDLPRICKFRRASSNREFISLYVFGKHLFV